VSDTVIVSWFGDHVSRKNPGALGAAVKVFNLIGMSAAVIGRLVSRLVKDMSRSLAGAFYLGALVVLSGTMCTAFAKEV